MEKHSKNRVRTKRPMIKRNNVRKKPSGIEKTAVTSSVNTINNAKTTGKHRTKKSNATKEKIYLASILIELILQIYSSIRYKISIIVAIYPFILIVASVLARRSKNKKLSNMICAIAGFFVVLITIVSIITAK